MEEIEYRFIEGTDNKAIVTSDGRVFKRYSVCRRHPEKGFTNFREVKPWSNGGYLTALLPFRGGCSIHRLVAEAFIPKPLGATEVDHINGNKTNNRVENLRWVTHKENTNNLNTKYKNVYSSNRKVWYNIQGFNPKTNHRTPVFKSCEEASNWITPEGKDIKPNSLCNCLSRKITYRNYFWTAKPVTGEEYQKILKTVTSEIHGTN